MNEILRTLKLAISVCALPIVATAVVSAQNLQQPSALNQVAANEINQDLEEVAPVASNTAGVITSSERHSHVVQLDEAGGVNGRIAVVDSATDATVAAVGVKVTINRRGEALATSNTDWNGEFRIDGLQPGAYTFIASSDTAMATFGIYVDDDPDQVPAANETQIDIVAIGDGSDPVRQVLNADYEFRQYTFAPRPRENDLPVVGGPNHVHLTDEGQLIGRVVPLEWESPEPRFNMVGNDVYLFQNGSLVAQAAVDADGYFVIENVAPGRYDFASAGPHGGAAFCIDVVDYDTVTQIERQSPTRLISARKIAYQASVDAVLGEPAGGPPNIEVEVTVILPDYPPIGGGTAGGFALGDFGGLISAALAAWIISEAIDDDGRIDPVIVPPVIIPPPVSPF